MVRKLALAFGILLGVSVMVLDGSASTAEACWGCRTRCCKPRCCAPTSCSTCYVAAPCYTPAPCNSCAPVYVAPSCSSCGTVMYAYPPVNVAQVPGYGAAYGYAAPVISAPSRVVTRTRFVTFR